MMINCNGCNTKAPHKARNLCKPCYERQHGRPTIVCTACGLTKPHAAFRICDTCYRAHRRTAQRDLVAVSTLGDPDAT